MVPLLSELKMKFDPAYLGKMYQDFNNRYFGGELPGVQVTEKKSKNILGAAEARVQYRDGRKASKVPPEWVTVTGVWISNSYNMTPEQVEKIMLHEMVHVWCYSQGIIKTLGDASHGREFKTKRDEIASASGLDIPMAESSDVFEVDGLDNMTHYGLKLTDGSNRVYWLRISKRLYDDIDTLQNAARRYRVNTLERFITKGSSSMFQMQERRKPERFLSFKKSEHEKDVIDSIVSIEEIQ